MSTLTGSEERDLSGIGNDGLHDPSASRHESPDSEASKSGKNSSAVDSSATHPPIEKTVVDEIFYYADVSCEVAFIMPSMLPRYQHFRHMTSHTESCDEDLGYVRRRRTRSGSTGSLETTSSGSGSQLDIKSKLSRQASEGTTVYEVNCHCANSVKWSVIDMFLKSLFQTLVTGKPILKTTCRQLEETHKEVRKITIAILNTESPRVGVWFGFL